MIKLTALIFGVSTNLTKIYQIFFESLRIRDDRFKFYELIEESNEIQIAKINYGKLLISNYADSDLTKSELTIINDIKKTEMEFLKEQEEKKQAEEKKRKEAEERRKQAEERKRKREEQQKKNNK